MSKDTSVEVAATSLEDMGLPEIRKLAATIYRIVVTKELDKNDLIKMIREKERGTTFAKIAFGDQPAPGWSRITLMKDPSPGVSNRPVYFSVNGRRYCVPRGVKVDVPNKLADGPMTDSIEAKLNEDQSEPINSTRRWKWEMIPCYPFNVHARTEGPDPHPGDEVARARRRQPEYDFRDNFGYWPTSEQLKDALKNGLIKQAKI